ncbi:MAG TPA: TRAP transporter small permease [Acetobacteraceae bacterium]|jgi:C4-dicarboxylate transporter DctQ subunit|nr:TRAP transporter small permease [Acetobacteraceae bacterium]
MMRAWDWVEKMLVGVLGMLAMIVGMWQILGRYLDSSLSSGWADEVIVYLLIWAIMIVSSQLVRHDGHVRPDVVLRLLGPSAQRWLEVFNCLAAIAFCGAMVWYGWQIVDTAQMMGETSGTELNFPMYLYYLALPVGTGLMLVRYIMRLIRYLFRFDPETMSVGHIIHEPLADLPMPGQPKR